MENVLELKITGYGMREVANKEAILFVDAIDNDLFTVHVDDDGYFLWAKDNVDFYIYERFSLDKLALFFDLESKTLYRALELKLERGKERKIINIYFTGEISDELETMIDSYEESQNRAKANRVIWDSLEEYEVFF